MKALFAKGDGKGLLETTRIEAVHKHLELPIDHYRQQVRDRLFPDP
jgi:hypothetical protein